MSRKANIVRHGSNHASGGSDPIPGPRFIYGQIANDGSILDAGSGDWSVDQSGPGGSYVITFDPPFAGTPTVVLTANNNNGAPAGGTGRDAYFVEQRTAVDASSVTVIVYDQDGTEDNDGGFNFIAVGPAA